MTPALLVVDMQNEFFADGSPAAGSLASAAEHINAAIQLFRRAGAPVIVVSDIEEPHRVPGSEPFGLHPSIGAEAGDLRIDKRFGNAFWKTDLDEQLRLRSVDMLVVSGFCAEYCVLSTYRGAGERGYAAALLRSGIASPHGDHVRMVEAICEVVSVGALGADGAPVTRLAHRPLTSVSLASPRESSPASTSPRAHPRASRAPFSPPRRCAPRPPRARAPLPRRRGAR